jgi:hypothetical protein
MINRVRRFLSFWYDFVIGDDWRVAAAVVVALLATAAVGMAGLPSWWVLPAAVVLVLPVSLWRARKSR